MHTIEIQGQKSRSTILIGERITNLKPYLPEGRVVIITDDQVRHYYQQDFPNAAVLQIGRGEGIKNLDTVQKLYQGLIDLEADRSTFILAIGGGVVCDIAGFTASTYLRGIRFGFVASTLLAQVDASVGGKNGVNFAGAKNMVGVFNQPEFVICDLDLLATLPKKEMICGLAEAVKAALIADKELFTFLEQHHAEILGLDREALLKLVYGAVTIKARIVDQDEREGGLRRLLNFGHTFGHALESTTGMSHGEAVGIGMFWAVRLSVQKGLLAPEKAQRVLQLLQNLGLGMERPFDPSAVLAALRRDKKRADDKIHFVLLQDIGQALVEPIALKELEKTLG